MLTRTAFTQQAVIVAVSHSQQQQGSVTVECKVQTVFILPEGLVKVLAEEIYATVALIVAAASQQERALQVPAPEQCMQACESLT